MKITRKGVALRTKTGGWVPRQGSGHNYSKPEHPDTDQSRVLAAELGWNVFGNRQGAYLTFDRLLEHAEILYWSNRTNPARPEAVA